MAAPKGNQFWMLRAKHGRDRIFTTPELLWEAACEYFQWCDDNPWITKKVVQKTVPTKKKRGKKIETATEQQIQQEASPIARPYSLTGFCIFIGASTQWWYTFKGDCKQKEEKDFLEIIARVEEIIRTQQFEGACVGAFNANIIARTLGLVDKRAEEHSGELRTGLTVIVKNEDDAEMVKQIKNR